MSGEELKPCPIVSARLKATMERISKQVAANGADDRERAAALAWCRANGNPHLGEPDSVAFLATTERERALTIALADLTDAFLDKHGCFPLDNPQWRAAMTAAYLLVGQPNTPKRESTIQRLRETDADNTPHSFDNAGYDTCRKCGNGAAHRVHGETR